MRTASHIAFIGAGTLALATFVVTAIGGGVRLRTDGSVLPLGVVAMAATALCLGVLVWVGTYLGARSAAFNQRTGRLAKWIAVVYGVGGVLLSLPLKTHAVMFDMPAGSDGTGHVELWRPWFLPLAGPVLIVVAALLTTRALAAALGKEAGRDA
jgi:hypothetical protein